MDQVTNILMSGVGGQGVLIASEVLALSALADGLEARQSEVHGVAQRGGSVVSHVRYGARVHSPLIRAGTAHALYALERLEALRYAHYLEPGGRILMDEHPVKPIRMPGEEEKPYPEDVPAFLRGKGYDVHVVPALDMAVALGEKRCANVILLGALAAFLTIGTDAWHAAIRERFPDRVVELNLRAFSEGRNLTATV